MKCIMTIDVEDWFHILDLPSTPILAQWDALESRVERNFLRLLDIVESYDAKATCFFLGWVANKFPNLVKETRKRGCEVASHGYSHRLIGSMSPEEFRADAAKARKTLEDILSEPIVGFRATGFSVTERTPWFFECLCEAGYEYDSSVFPAGRGHGGMKRGLTYPHRVRTASGSVIELPATVANVFGKRVCLFGGGYFRLAPYSLVKEFTRRVLATDRPVVFYVHPREIDPEQPRLPMGVVRRFKSYVNLSSTESKLGHLMADFPMTTCAEFIAGHPIDHEVSI